MTINKRLTKDKSLTQLLSSFSNLATASMYTSLAGKVVKYDTVSNTAEIELGSMQASYAENGVEYEPLSNLYEVPILLDRAGSTAVTLPIVAGDECLVLFNHKSMNIFRLTGSAGKPDHLKNGDIEDAYAIIKQVSIPKNDIVKIKDTAYQIRGVKDNNSYIEYSQVDNTTTIRSNEKTTIVAAPDLVTITASDSSIVIAKDGTITINAKKEVKVNTPQAEYSGTVKATDFIIGGLSLKGHVHSDSGENAPHKTGTPE